MAYLSGEKGKKLIQLLWKVEDWFLESNRNFSVILFVFSRINDKPIFKNENKW
jgi:hypothetical protein